ncbi:MAG: glycosyltransferase family 39 protein [Clostridia bacterium]|nr:glycosyltransferase family 39 protein [Clostridia bacterium]
MTEQRSTGRWHVLILLIYVIAILFFTYKMWFYCDRVGRFPDEMAHISYIAYLEKNPCIIPDFSKMTIMTRDTIGNTTDGSIASRENFTGTFKFTGSFNYLGHPPLYYQIMRLSGGVRIVGDTVTIHIVRLRVFSMAIALLAMLLVLYIGFSRIRGRPVLHLLYAAICVSVPMLAYDCAGINNDTLALLGVTVFILGLLRFAEKKRNTGTFLLIATGVSIAFFSKLTAGVIVLVATAIFLLITLIREKNLRFILSKRFLITLPLYLITAAYFIAVHLQTGSFQPSFVKLEPQQFYASSFYVAPLKRTFMRFMVYFNYYASRFVGTWTGIASHVSLYKKGSIYSLNQIGLESLIVLPLLLVFFRNKDRSRNTDTSVVFAVYFAIVITALTQFLRAFYEFRYVSGYLGGFQSRYYLCGISAIALAVVFIAQRVGGLEPYTKEKDTRPNGGISYLMIRQVSVQVLCVLFVALLVYEDFVYFVLHFTKYL